MTSPIADASVYSDLAGLASLKRDARAQDPAALREVARQFESIFAKMVLSSMRSASFGDPLLGSDQQDFYQGMFDDQLSMELTKGRGLGLADMLVQQLTRAGLAPGAEKPGTGSPLVAAGGARSDAAIQTAHAPGSTSAADTSNAADHAPAHKVTLHGPTSLSALDSTTAFISRMLAGNAIAENAKPTTWRPGSPEDFVRELWPCAEEAARELGVDPRHLIAQAALETGWGKSLPCDTEGNTSFNLFGIKATGDWPGDSVSVRTLEFEGGLPVARQARFRAYGSAADSFKDYVAVLRDNPRYANALNTGSDTRAFATALQKGGYATDPAYASKIASIAQNLPTSLAALKSSESAPMPFPLETF